MGAVELKAAVHIENLEPLWLKVLDVLDADADLLCECSALGHGIMSCVVSLEQKMNYIIILLLFE